MSGRGDQLLAEAHAARDDRARDMPSEQDAINAIYRGYSRLKELGWNDGIYMPKDGTVVTVIQVASTGQFDCSYTGEWPNGYFNTMEGRDVYPSRSVPPLFRPRKSNT